MTQEQSSAEWANILAELQRLREGHGGGRVLLGIAGAPGSGKSTLAARLEEQFGPEVCVVVPMDGFHLATNVIAGTPLEHRRGAIDTFDAWGFASLIERIAAQGAEPIYAPSFRRGLEEPIAGSIAVDPRAQIVIVEGNYLLVDARPWSDVRSRLTACWFVETDERARVARLIQRHIDHGMLPGAADEWAHTVDGANASFVQATRNAADRVFTW